MPAPQAVATPVVLVVDDEPMVMRLMERTFASAGFLVLAASSGEEALALAEASPAPPAVLVTDVRMHPIDGPELARLITSR
jgi:CheY-like chemotaxis protein